MKRFLLSFVAAMMIVVASAKDVNHSFKVKGYQSKAKIESAAKSVKGVHKASYRAKDKKLFVCYDNERTAPKNIKAAVDRVDRKQNVCNNKKNAPKKGCMKKQNVKKCNGRNR
nr:hypothetical protein [Prevotella sp.]